MNHYRLLTPSILAALAAGSLPAGTSHFGGYPGGSHFKYPAIGPSSDIGGHRQRRSKSRAKAARAKLYRGRK